ncbi:MAG: glycosyltransferase family 2 protein [Acidobacteria bacterium]|nr:glycosyltransferase family 2 protein [Acidobacteriota bacterium]
MNPRPGVLAVVPGAGAVDAARARARVLTSLWSGEVKLMSAAQARAAGATLQAVYALADAELLAQLPGLADAAFPAASVVELQPSAGLADGELLWRAADAVVVCEAAQVLALAGGSPAASVRHVPRGSDEDAAHALAQLPLLGGEPRVSVIIPVRGNPKLVRRTVASVLERTPPLMELILVDDASPDDSLATLGELAARDARVRVMRQDEQRGFAATCNRGLCAARGDVLVLLNSDTVVTSGWSERMTHHLAAPKAGAVGPLSNRAAWPQGLARVAYDPVTLDGLETFAEQLARACARRARAVARLTGLCLAIPRRTLRRIGGFDPQFFPGNFEDDDWCLRLLAAGLVPYRADDAFVHHEGSRSFALEPKSYRRVFEENWHRFAAKWQLPRGRAAQDGYTLEDVDLASARRDLLFLAPWDVPVGTGGDRLL